MSDQMKGYIPYYGESGLREVDPRIGFTYNRAYVSKKNYDQILAEVKEVDAVSIDTETTSLDFDVAKLVSVNFSYSDKNYVMLFWHNFKTQNQAKLPEDSQLRDLVSEIIHRPRCYYWNRFYDQRILINNLGFTAADFKTGIDGMDLLWMLDTNVKQGLSLKEQSRRLLGVERTKFEDTFDESALGEGMYTCDPRALLDYGALDGYCTLELGEMLYRIFIKKYPFLLKLHLALEDTLFEFEEQPQVLDVKSLGEMQIELQHVIEDTKREFYEKYGIINLGSPAKKAALLESLGYNTGYYGKPKKDGTRVMSVKKDLLQNLVEKENCEPAALMLKYSSNVVLLNNFISKAYKFVSEGKVPRFHFYDSRVPTMRMASGSYRVNRKPIDHFIPMNFMAIPKGTQMLRRVNFNSETWDINFSDDGQYLVETASPKLNFRKCLLPHDSNSIIVRGDFSGQEMVIAANESREPVWLDAFKHHLDPHSETAKGIWGINEVDGNQRKKAKIANFLLLYEGSYQSLARKMKISLEEAEDFYHKYKASLPQLYAWKARIMFNGRREGTVFNAFGVPRRVKWYYDTRNRKTMEFADRTCVNTMIQGAAGIMGRLAMIKTKKLIYTPGSKYYNKVFFVNMVHDELVLSCDKSVATEFIFDFYKLMTSVSAPRWEIKVDCGIDVGNNYGELVPVELVDGKIVPICKEEAKAVEEPEEEISDISDEDDEFDEFGGTEF